MRIKQLITMVRFGGKMADLAFSRQCCREVTLALAVAGSLLGAFALQDRAAVADDTFQRAVNYVFTGQVDPKDGPKIVDRESCIVLVAEPKFKRYARYYLNRFKMDVSRITKKYAGRQVLYELEVEGDDVIFEYLKADNKTVDYGFKSAHIPLPGSIEQTEKALQLIFAEHCKADKPKPPF
jgi:hypothetical protein